MTRQEKDECRGDICGARSDHRKAGKGDGSLEEAFADYEEGMKLVKSCNEKIEMIEKRILVLSGDQAEGTKDDGQF